MTTYTPESCPAKSFPSVREPAAADVFARRQDGSTARSPLLDVRGAGGDVRRSGLTRGFEILNQAKEYANLRFVRSFFMMRATIGELRCGSFCP